MTRLHQGIGAAVGVAAVLVFFCAGPLASAVLSRALQEPVDVSSARWRGLGDLDAATVRVGDKENPKARLDGVRTSGLLFFGLWGAPMHVTYERFEAGGRHFGPSSARIRRTGRGVSVFTRLDSAEGRAAGGLLWGSKGLVKAHGRVNLSEEGLDRIPGAWRKRLSAGADGPAFFAAYAGGRVVLRGRSGPILEAAWSAA